MSNTTDTKICSLCGTEFDEWGNNPDPLADLEEDGPCCDVCNSTKVIPARLAHIFPPAPNMTDGDYGRGKTIPSWESDSDL